MMWSDNVKPLQLCPLFQFNSIQMPSVNSFASFTAPLFYPQIIYCLLPHYPIQAFLCLSTLLRWMVETVYMCVYVSVFMCMSVYVCVHVCLCICMCAPQGVLMLVFIFVCLWGGEQECVCVYVCMCEGKCVFFCVLCCAGICPWVCLCAWACGCVVTLYVRVEDVVGVGVVYVYEIFGRVAGRMLWRGGDWVGMRWKFCSSELHFFFAYYKHWLFNFLCKF